ncbi:hypothetical protein CTAYLR_001158 [Chrysophaeum taylorii]|uniref:Enoyl reductase (ER) domain-containing protein n=1 Tax=Chrysophaeum taylorii TaxID=2483200 RepID=A0AAD7UQJ1_9STRA|nr:hypothetical protein CTAYLR_001158 [Chrysophaeum taylorii]
MALMNSRWILVKRPEESFDPARDVAKETECVKEVLEPGTAVVKVEVLSVDAFVRTMLDSNAYHGKIEIGSTLPALGVGTVVRGTSLASGTRVLGMVGAQTYATAKESELTKLPLSPKLSLGLCGVTTGLTAYVGVYKVCAPPRGEIAVVTAAAGAVGSVAAQLCKRAGAKRVIGIAGGAGRCAALVEKGIVDVAIDYRDEDVGERLDELAPDGVGFFFDLVGGPVLDVVLDRLAPKARVVICGAASQYDNGNLNAGRDAKGHGGGVVGPSNYLKLAERGASMHGYNVIHHASSFPEAVATMLYYDYMSIVTMHEHCLQGIDAFPTALAALFRGARPSSSSSSRAASSATEGEVARICETRIGKLLVELE